MHFRAQSKSWNISWSLFKYHCFLSSFQASPLSHLSKSVSLTTWCSPRLVMEPRCVHPSTSHVNWTFEHLWFGFGKFPLKMSNFQFFSLRLKKISLDWVKKQTGQKQVGPLFTAAQKYARVGSGPISSLLAPPDCETSWKQNGIRKILIGDNWKNNWFTHKRKFTYFEN